MSTLPQVLNFENTELTAVIKDGELFFPATALAKTLGLANPHQAISSHVDSCDLQKLEVIDKLGRTQKINYVNESGMYALIFGSTKDEAKRFKRWVTAEVLPAIRKTGSYNKEVDIVPLTLVAQWADLLVGKNPTDTLFEIKERYQVGNLTELQESHISNEIQSLLEKVDQYISQNKKPPVELKQVNTIIGALNTPYELRLSLHAIVKLVSKCYLDNVTAYRTINARLEHACKLANLDWITHDRLSTALRELADITDDAVKHRDTLQQIDKNAIVCLSVVGNNAIGFMA